MRYNQQLDEEFKKLGFLNFKEFLKTASPVDPVSPQTNNYLLDDLNSDPEGIGYFFTVKKDEYSDKWAIDSIKACYQFSTERNIEGVIVIDKTFYSQNGPVPVKEDIRKEILERVRIEKVGERFYCSQNKGNTVYKRFRM